jgi:Asp-tRNA(Asn)/Glu-tRNA(Gln) amidotransferase A subunit family amidase
LAAGDARARTIAQLSALSIPCGFAEGLPICLQLAVAPLEEQRLIDLGRAFQAVTVALYFKS